MASSFCIFFEHGNLSKNRCLYSVIYSTLHLLSGEFAGTLHRGFITPAAIAIIQSHLLNRKFVSGFLFIYAARF